MPRKYVKGITGLLLLRQFVRFLAFLRGRRKKPAADESSSPAEPSAEAESASAKLRQRLMVSLLIGVVIESALILGKSLELPILVATEDAAMDFVMRQFRNVKRDEHTAFVLLEADQATFEMWEQPFYFHRDRVLEMIRFASGFEGEAGQQTAESPGPSPALIIVDIDLSKRGRNDGSTELERYLEEYSVAPDVAPLILARTLKLWPKDESDDALPRERTSFLESVVPRDANLESVVSSDANRNIFWASPHYQLDQDYRIRRWLLWQRTRVGAERSVLPSVQLLAQVLLSEQGEPTAVERYRALIDDLDAIDSCEESAEGRRVVDIHRGGEQHVVDLCETLTSQRLIYTIPYSIPAGELRPKVNGDVPVLQTAPARQLAEQDRGLLAMSVVVIGGTYRETRDWYATPVGEMPGAMVVINAVHSLGAHGPLQPPHPAVKMAIVVLLVLMMTVIFARLSTLLGYLLASAFVLVLLVPVSFLMFRSGVWVDFALPLLAVQLHEFAAEFESIDFKSRKRTTATPVDDEAGTDESAVEDIATTNDDTEAV